MDDAPSSDERTSILVVDDHRVFADLLAFALEGQPDLRCVGTAHSVEEGLALADRLRPDVVVMDVRLGEGDGIAASAELTRTHPDIRVVVLTAHATQSLLEDAAAAGACCLLPKDGSLDDMLTALRAARRDGFVVHPALLRTLMVSRYEPRTQRPDLTRREQDVLQMLAQGRDVRSTARALGISVATCRGYVRSLLVKLNAHSQLEAVALAKKGGLIDGETPAR
jgi:DNA-binding NarL/FixJ family response regulator